MNKHLEISTKISVIIRLFLGQQLHFAREVGAEAAKIDPLAHAIYLLCYLLKAKAISQQMTDHNS